MIQREIDHYLSQIAAEFPVVSVMGPKIYFSDTGLLCYLLGIRSASQVTRDPLFGGIFENLVVAEMRKQRLNHGLRDDMYFMRNQNGKEIDLVIEESRRLHLYEIKSGMEMSPSFARNIKAYRAALGEEVLSASIVYSGASNPHTDPKYVNYGDLRCNLFTTCSYTSRSRSRSRSRES